MLKELKLEKKSGAKEDRKMEMKIICLLSFV